MWLIKYLKNVQIICFLITSGNVASFLISNMVSGLLDHLQIFWWLYLVELREFLTGLGILELWNLIYLKPSLEFGIKNSSLLEFQVEYLISLSFLNNRQLPVVLDGKSLQECPVHAWDPQDYLLESALFLLYVNEITDGVICNISMLLILLSAVTVIRYLICGKC